MRQAWVGLIYFGLASLSILSSRFDGGLAFLWIANAFAIAWLLRKPRRDWALPVVWVIPASIAASGIVGVGWSLAPILAVANVAEVLVAAWLLRWARSSLMPLGSLRWTTTLFLAAGIAAPLAMAVIAAGPMLVIADQPVHETMIRVVVGHGGSNMTFIPIFKLFLTGGREAWREAGQTRSVREGAPLFALLITTSIAVFSQNVMPLLFLPILPLAHIVFGCGGQRSAIALMTLAIIGGTATWLGYGPVHSMRVGAGLEMQFFQLYLLATVMSVVPIAAQLRSRRLLAQRIHKNEVRYRMIAGHSSDIITHSDLHGRALFVSPSIERISGYSPSEILGRNILDFVHPADQAHVMTAYKSVITSPAAAQHFEYRTRQKSGEWCWFENNCRGVRGANGRVESVVSIVRDITERKGREAALELAALTDPLTELPNRRAFRDAATRLLDKGQQRGPSAIALLDIDFFKRVNDRFGHEAGDEVLKTFASVSQRLLRHHDTIARMGGEEFAIIFPGLDVNSAAKVCDRIRCAVGKTPFVTKSGRVDITISGGVAALRDDGLDGALRRADEALYDSKEGGRDRLTLAA